MTDSHGCPHQGLCSTAPGHFQAVAELSGLSSLRAISVSHGSIGIGALQHLSVGCESAAGLHNALTASGIESVVLVTCNRAEIYWRARAPGDSELVRQLFAHMLGDPDVLASGAAALLSGKSVAQHLFRVCAGLESLVLGEAEILGQVRAARDACPGAGPFLNGVVHAAIRAGRMARAETTIGSGALSVASAAVQLLAESLVLADSRVVVVGAGDTGLKAARHLRALGVGTLIVANRTFHRAERVAALVSGDPTGLDALAGELRRADAVVCAVGAPQPVIRTGDLRHAATERGGRPLVVVDLGVPPGVARGAVRGVRRVDLASLEQVVGEQRLRRTAEIPAVERVLGRELDRLQAWARHHAVRPLASDLRRKVEAIRRAELAQAQKDLPQDWAHAEVLDRLTRRLLERVLAIPFTTLEAGDVPLDPAQAQYLRRLFALEPGAPA